MAELTGEVSALTTASLQALQSVADATDSKIHFVYGWSGLGNARPSEDTDLILVAPCFSRNDNGGWWFVADADEVGYRLRYWPSFTPDETTIYCDVTDLNLEGAEWSTEQGFPNRHPMFTRLDDVNGIPVYGSFHIFTGNCPHMLPEFEELLIDLISSGLQRVTPEERAARRDELTEESLRDWATHVRSQKITQQRNKLAQLEATYATANVTVQHSIMAMREEQKLLDALMAVTDDVTDTILDQWRLLQEHTKVEVVTFADSKFTVLTTKDIEMVRESTGDTRWLGQFKIEIPITATDEILIHNLNTRRGGRNHPHVQGNGHPCFGGHQTTIYELVSQGEIYAAVDIIIQYLERLNESDDWGRFGSYWFDVEDERPLLRLEEQVETVEERLNIAPMATAGVDLDQI